MSKNFKTNDAQEHIKQQHCPTCKQYVKYSSRYLDYVCSRCEKLAVNKQGYLIDFFNITLDGHGCQGKYIDSGKLYRSAKCFIKGVTSKAEEAYLGGIVIRPLKIKTLSKRVLTKEE
ncbi:hypothetical protein [Mucilaginibacter jinjuensis]|uniref:Uncharacterized protein n=1 Tax=Mucilaginibacter jinjuensis TaxID=1176721 RepID=A0ABY7TB46_9SPHI|nr:hypothetical protein [Mucilaginibacter jinjuensis]WCT13666.1 hypothetical protein PQO05_06920 [Mucilaginibacter jinjuensis]